MARRLAGAVVALSAADEFAKRDTLPPVVAGRLPLYDGKKCSSGTFAAVT